MIDKNEMPDFLYKPENGEIYSTFIEDIDLTDYWNKFVDRENLKFENERLELKAQITALKREIVQLQCHIDSLNYNLNVLQ
ncbi:MAG: hypothetical protein ABFC34_13800 [Methanobacterium sp.]